MHALECVNCGGALPGSPAAGAVRCLYCGTLNEATGVQPSAAPARRSPAPRVPFGLAFAAAAGLCLLVVGFAAVLARATRSSAPARATGPSRPSGPREKRYRPGELASASERGWLKVDVPAPPTPLAHFEAVAGLPWALAVARAWSADAVLERIDVKRLRPDGTLDLAGDPEAEVMYRFISPGQIAAYSRMADLSSKAEVPYGLFFRIEKGTSLALVVRGKPSPRGPFVPAPKDPALAPWEAAHGVPGGPEPLPPHPALLPLPRYLSVAREQPGFPEKPYYEGCLIFLRRNGWLWSLGSLSGRESLPRLRAEDAAPLR